MLIGIVGNSGSGKDALADYLKSRYGFTKVALADPLKRIIKEVFNFSFNSLWGPSEQRNLPDSRYKGLTPRKALQTLGTEWGRELYQDVWVDYALRVYNDIKGGRGYNPEIGVYAPVHYNRPEVTGVVIPDARFQNEVNAIIAAGGKVVGITRPGFEGKQAMAAGVENHVSETGISYLTGISCVFHNKGTLPELYKQVDILMEAWKCPQTPLTG